MVKDVGGGEELRSMRTEKLSGGNWYRICGDTCFFFY